MILLNLLPDLLPTTEVIYWSNGGAAGVDITSIVVRSCLISKVPSIRRLFYETNRASLFKAATVIMTADKNNNKHKQAA